MNNVSQFYNLFNNLGGITSCICLCIAIAYAVKKVQYLHLAWLVPLAIGQIVYRFSAILYDMAPGYWHMLAHRKSYPLLFIGAIAGVLMIYGWIRLAVAFRNMRVVAPSREAQEIIEQSWPPPPVQRGHDQPAA